MEREIVGFVRQHVAALQPPTNGQHVRSDHVRSLYLLQNTSHRASHEESERQRSPAAPCLLREASAKSSATGQKVEAGRRKRRMD